MSRKSIDLETKGLANRTSVKDYADLAGYWREAKTEPNRKEYLYKRPLDLPRSTILQHPL